MCCQNNSVMVGIQLTCCHTTSQCLVWGGAKKEKLDPEDWAMGMGPIGKDLEGGKRV